MAALGILGADLAAESKEEILSVTEDIEEEIPLYKGYRVKNQGKFDGGNPPEESPDYEHEYISVDRSEWVSNIASQDAVNNLWEKLDSSENREYISVGITSENPGRKIKVWIDVSSSGIRRETAEEVIDQTPQSIEGVAGNDSLEETKEFDVVHELQENEEVYELDTNCGGWFNHYDNKYREKGLAMASGCRSETQDELGSLGFRATKDGYAYVITAGHVFSPSDDSDTDVGEGDELFQPSDPDSVGYASEVVNNSMNYMDAAEVYCWSSTSPGKYLAEENDDEYYEEKALEGVASWSYLNYLMDNALEVYKAGASTGRCSGYIADLEEKDNGVRQLVVDINSSGGDSGGPHLTSEYDHLKVSGIHKSVRGDYRVAVYAGSILDEFNLEFY